MSLKLQDADPTSDFPALARALFEEAREAAIHEAAMRLEDWHTHDPTSHWQKVIDTETGNIATGALWNIYPENPFAAPKDLPVTWFPDDGSRKYAEQLIESHGQPRARVGQRPHVSNRGMGMKKADEMGLELFLEATPMGRLLYERSGLIVIEKNVITPQTDSADNAWREMEAKVGSSTHYLIWRPPGGYKEGDTVRP
ncbi:hypothetical protein F4677DRAFT_453806 [Hypoxylon crocopeplum]|nr:hypothetical protein F4677DRAFT_453806 [Hypoxylon crocopeplum]